MLEGRLRLPDGRTLAWRESGPAGARPVLHFHGSASSRFEPAPPSELLEQLGLRLLQLDRPGYGASDPHRGRRLEDWAGDCTALADELGVERLPLSGWSAGAVHALACAAFRPERFPAIALISTPGPLEREELAGLLPQDCRRLLALRRVASPVLRAGCALTAFALRRRPRWSLDWFERLLPEADRRALDRPGLRERWDEMIRESWRQGGGAAWRDAELLVDPWGFELARVRVPVRLWHGTEDRLTPLPMAEWVAAQLPAARLVRLEGEGHALWLSHWEEILRDLLEAAGPA